MKDNIFKKLNIICILFNTIILKIFFSIFSPIRNVFFTDTDASIFYGVGKNIVKGAVLYKDIFDHKTPYIYFIYAFCSLIDYKHIGLFLFEIVVHFVTAYFLYKIIVLLCKNEKVAFLTIIITQMLFVVPYITFGYNRTEMFAVMFLMIANYIFIKYFCEIYDGKIAEFRPINMFIIGILAASTFMTNIRAIILFLPPAFVLLYILIKNKLYKNIIKVFVMGMFGVIVCILPYIIYMIMTNSFNDMVNAVFLANIAYMKSQVETHNDIFGVLGKFIKDNMIFYILLLVSLVLFIFKKFNRYVKSAILSQFILAIIYITFGSRVHDYYLVILMPYLVIIPICIFIKFQNVFTKNFLRTLIFSISFLIIFFIMFYQAFNNRYLNSKNRSSKIKNAILEYRDDIKNTNVLALGFNPEIYELVGCDIYYKYFFIPLLSYDKFPYPYEAQYRYIEKRVPDVVITKESKVDNEFPKNMSSQISYILNSSYELVKSVPTNGIEGTYKVYIKKGDE